MKDDLPAWVIVAVLVASMAVLVLLFGCSEAQALPIFFAEFQQRYASPNDPAFAQRISELRCNVCHTGQSKKQRNEYGVALEAYLMQERFTVDRLRVDPIGARREIQQALQRAENDKSARGVTFGEILLRRAP